MTSKLTRVISFRVPVSVFAKLERKVLHSRGKYKNVHDCVKARVVYDTTRKH